MVSFFIFVGTFYFYYGTFYEIGLDSIIAVTRINVQNMGFVSQKKSYLTLVQNDLEIRNVLDTLYVPPRNSLDGWTF